MTIHERAGVDVVRTTTPLTHHWAFVQDDSLTDEAALAATGEEWDTVRLPHTWNAHDAATTTATEPYKRGIGWYRLELEAPTSGATHWLQFDGASIVADVWLNGHALGSHAGAFTAFRFDLTAALVPGRNVVLVRTDNRAPTTNDSPTAIAPLSGDFNISGGLYRPVSLVSTPSAVHIALNDLGSSGVFLTTTHLDEHEAVVAVRTKLSNDGSTPATVDIQVRVLDATGATVAAVATGATVASGRHEVTVAAGTDAEHTQHLVIPDPRRWDGRADPHLYTVVVDLVDGDGAGNVIDRVVQRHGIRELRVDSDEGFFLNGRSTPLRGVGLHQDVLGQGWAIGPAEVNRSFDLIDEIGANTVRLAHYPHNQHTLDQADERGLVVWAELPFVNESVVECTTTTTVPARFADNAELQLRELIRQQHNHPSIAMWSIGNEVGNFGRCQGVDTVTPLLRALHTVAKAEDPSRVTTLADSTEDPVIPLLPPLSDGGITDIWAINRYYLWYYGDDISLLGRDLDHLHAKYPHQPIGVSEYGAGAALTHQTDDPRGGPVPSFDLSGGTRVLHQPEGYANHVHEQSYAEMARRPYVWGTYLWNLFDFGSGIRNEGDLRGVNSKGLATFDRRDRKDPFFFYRANWSAEPVTYLTGRRYVDRAYAVADVTVYSNAASVTLSVNGTELATRAAAESPWKVFRFPGVRLCPGANTVVAVGDHAGTTETATTVTDTVTWTLSEDNATNVYLAAGQPTTGFVSDGHRYGSDTFFTGGRGETLHPSGVGALFEGGPPLSNDRTPVRGSADEDEARLYESIRRGTFRYAIPVEPGSYAVTLGFVEPDATTEPGQRVFDVRAEGRVEIVDLDVLVESGGTYRTIVTRTFTVDVIDGHLHLDFVPTVGDAVVSTITITRI